MLYNIIISEQGMLLEGEEGIVSKKMKRIEIIHTQKNCCLLAFFSPMDMMVERWMMMVVGTEGKEFVAQLKTEISYCQQK